MKRGSLFCAGWWPFLVIPALLLLPVLAMEWRSIESNVARNANAELEKRKMGWVSVETFNRGRDVLLVGSPPNDQAVTEAKQIVAQAKGVRKVEHNGDPVVAPPPLNTPEFNVIVTGNSVVLRGVLSNQAEIDKTIANAASIYGAENVINKLSVGENVAELPDTNLLSSLFNKGLGLNTLLASLKNNEITLKGDIATQETKDSIISSIQEKFAGQINDQLAVIVPVEPAKPEVDKCKQLVDELLKEGKINFETGKATIAQESLELMNRITEVSKQCPEAKFEVSGHTDSTGASDANLTLSQKRAQAVADYLINQGLPTTQFTAKGYGANKPIADNATREGRAKNRRIEFNLLTPSDN